MYFSLPLNFVMNSFLVASDREGARHHRTAGGGDLMGEDRRAAASPQLPRGWKQVAKLTGSEPHGR